jgi:cytochrome oxidase Cu insertion factor (SCO1/SenC/PrrC family)
MALGGLDLPVGGLDLKRTDVAIRRGQRLLLAANAAIPLPPASLGVPVDFVVPPAIANIPLTKPDGTTTNLAAYRGKPVMIADYLTLCSDICPMITADARALARALGADGYAQQAIVLEITVDPVRDTVPRMKAYEKLFGGVLPNWTVLRASPADTAKLWKYFGVQYNREKEASPPDIDWLTHKPLTYDIAHSDDLIFIDANGHERFVVNADPDARGLDTPAKLVKHLSPQGKHALRSPNPVASWTVSQGLEVFSWLTNHRFATPS